MNQVNEVHMGNQNIASRIIQLTSFQKEKLYCEIHDFIQFNEIVLDASVSICQVCGCAANHHEMSS